MGSDTRSDELRWRYFNRAEADARPKLARFSDGLGLSVPLLQKIRQKRRRVTEATLRAARTSFDRQGRFLIHDARVLSALGESSATHAVDLSVTPWGNVMYGEGDVEELLGYEASEVIGVPLGRLFQTPPPLADRDKPIEVTAWYADPDSEGAVTFGTAIVSAENSPITQCDWFVTILFKPRPTDQ